MTSMTTSKTPLYKQHVALGARITPFAGWDMPLYYSSIIEEHEAVRNKAGIFDISHMGTISLSGDDALALLEKVTCNDVSTMKLGQVRYNAILNDDGGLIDDITIYRKEEKNFTLIVNASNRERVLTRLQIFATDSVKIEDLSPSLVLLALQGPMAEKILARLIGNDIREIRYYYFKLIQYQNELITISRTGYTGEDGFEIYAPISSGTSIWENLLELGKTDGLIPSGLGARDILRLEALYPLYGHELSEEWTPVESGIGWIAKEKSIHYPGYQRIIDQKKNGSKHLVTGIIMDENGIPRESCKIFDASGEREIGRVLSGAYSPTLKKGIATAFLPIEFTKNGTLIQIELRSKKFRAHVHSGSFVQGSAKREKK